MRRRLLISLTLSLCLYAIGSQAQQSQPDPASLQQEVSLLQGKLKFELPGGFTASELPAGSAEEGTAGASGQLFVNNDARQVVVISEAPTPGGVAAADDDHVFLNGAAQGFVSQQKQASADYQPIDEDSLRSGELGLRRINAKGSFAGTPTLNTSLLAGSGPRLVVVQIVSREDDPQGHAQLVQRVLESMPAKVAALRPR
ncbi:hypothetical protein [Bordetella holmesii]|uniref:Exported protein n=2 Tax=Bordetella holmesii TaxID=35814 RepID=A0ABN0RZM3_9BORD|nr:hypothetical protein [Bordetella holmesii]AHV93181.1 putative exported protein [Bordetella holmesii ATCC 51541]AIT24814.1 putative exported protein [Bordetella holmesii 44057]EWM45385.1 putative exported protein [Bordetella holmesii 70147]EWM48859.1 putative exported protein [Bordetella holmesii 41130]EWM49500.1 putative exported protein [Bordetella holmesii 35009]